MGSADCDGMRVVEMFGFILNRKEERLAAMRGEATGKCCR